MLARAREVRVREREVHVQRYRASTHVRVHSHVRRAHICISRALTKRMHAHPCCSPQVELKVNEKFKSRFEHNEVGACAARAEYNR